MHSPPPQLQSPPPADGPPPSPHVVGYGVLALVMGALLLGGVTFNRAGDAAPSGGHGDRVDEAQRAAIEANFIAYTARLEPQPVTDAAELARLLNDAGLSQDELGTLMTQLRSGDLQLGRIMLWDNFDEDGDIVQVTTEGFSLTVPLSHAPQPFYVPFRKGGTIQLTGVRDGGGGITAAIETSSGMVPLPLMAPGQMLAIPQF